MLGRGVLGEEIEKLEAFERNESDVGISMVAWVSDGNNQLVSYDYVVLYRNITNLIIIAPADYVT